ncbi:MAG TPA: WbqC family protein [Saprospiraceae bacterium]|nr:WbqC family protein [Saprospiraceae bacterium]HPN69949.1 WbqC family protein [Saprospiraceae bacterium]
MKVELVISPSCNFPSIAHMAYLCNAEKVKIETNENYQKRSCRNRYGIVDHYGTKTLSIPLKKGKNEQLPISKVQISHDENWQIQHLRTIKTAYGKAPYFEYYFDHLSDLFHKNHPTLLEFNNDCLNFFYKHAQMQINLEFTSAYLRNYENGLDLRTKIPILDTLPYYAQVFEDRLQFIPNASVLDLLFCCGPAAGSYLRSIKIMK